MQSSAAHTSQLGSELAMVLMVLSALYVCASRIRAARHDYSRMLASPATKDTERRPEGESPGANTGKTSTEGEAETSRSSPAHVDGYGQP